ncbi:DUF4400 domain-containing protein [uncultured Lamprocystis sp.]|jgi:hypothetical protein|uniref:DUF4400 domain-containing protein n=1 Tax=uncultured Lamprocystis sp. TaxID=543132 RepID=UPI0025CD75FB|nr:DUF4400 domain-containing protein [uncultured Lamprocystis sp.]
MLDDSHEGREGKGVWLWTIASGLILFVMEFILFAALVPTDWARQVSARELASLVDTVGPDTTAAIVARAAGWYEALFIRTGLHTASYQILLPGPDTGGAGLAKLADSPFWAWLAGRLTVVWWSLGQACQRLAVLLSWWPLLGLLALAAWGDGWLRRRIRQCSFAYASPLTHHLALRVVLWLVIGALLLLVAPVPLPALGVPVVGAAIALLLGLALANTQKRL